MAKPSIFSRDYEKKMRKRRRRIALMSLLLVVLVISIFVKIKLQHTDFSQWRNKIQAWVDSDRLEEVDNNSEDIAAKDETSKKPDETVIKEPEKSYIDLNIAEGIIIRAEYSDINGDKKFIGIEEGSNISGIEYNISPSKQEILILDRNQNILLFDINGQKKDITRKEYVSQAGDVFSKESILQNYTGYIWHAQPKFIDDTKIVYISQLPYFGGDANKYIWIYDITNGSENCLWNNMGKEVTVGSIVEGKGLEITIDGAKYYISSNGGITQ